VRFFGKGLLRSVLPILKKLGPKEIAGIAKRLDEDDLRTLLLSMDREKRAKVLAHMDAGTLRKASEALEPKEFARTLLYLDDHVAAQILRSVPENRRAEIFIRLPSKKQVVYSFLMKYSEDVAGGWMRTDILKVFPEERVRDILEKAQGFAGWAEEVYVVADDGTLVGKVPMQLLLGAKRTTKVLDIMEGAYHVEATEPVERLVQVFREHRPRAVAVTYRGRLLGVVTAEDAVTLMDKLHAKQMARMFMLSDIEHINDPVLRSMKNRTPWLIVNLFTEFVVAFSINLFEDTLKNFVVLAILMPIVASEGGNAATQTMAIIVRSMATGEANKKRLMEILRKELVLAVLEGAVVGLVAGIMALVWKGNIMAAIAMALAVPLNLLIAAATGVLVPYVLKALRIDPASASTVILTTFTDVCGFAGFLGIATVLSNVLPPAWVK